MAADAESAEPAQRSSDAGAPTPQVSVVLPVYDEQAVLADSLARLTAALCGVTSSFEIVCVDDGSRDASHAIARSAAELDWRVRVERLAKNRGKGAAVRAGMLAARGQKRLFMDADLSTPLAELPRFLGALDAGYDVVIGNRRAPGAEIERRQPQVREALGKGFTLLTRALLAPGVHDFTCGFKAFRAAAAEAIFSRSTLAGWAFDAELVVIAQVLGLKLVQVPVRWRHEQDTKVRLLGAVTGSLRDLLVIAGRRCTGRYR